MELHCSGKERRNKGITDAHKMGEQFESEYEEEKRMRDVQREKVHVGRV